MLPLAIFLFFPLRILTLLWSINQGPNVMNPRDHILSRQLHWARGRGIDLLGSKTERGEKVYAPTLGANLFRTLSDSARRGIEAADGGEMRSTDGHPAKMQALHSSSALGVNVFDYWTDSADLSPLLSACGFTSAEGPVIGTVAFEAKFPISEYVRYLTDRYL